MFKCLWVFLINTIFKLFFSPRNYYKGKCLQRMEGLAQSQTIRKHCVTRFQMWAKPLHTSPEPWSPSCAYSLYLVEAEAEDNNLLSVLTSLKYNLFVERVYSPSSWVLALTQARTGLPSPLFLHYNIGGSIQGPRRERRWTQHTALTTHSLSVGGSIDAASLEGNWAMSVETLNNACDPPRPQESDGHVFSL